MWQRGPDGEIVRAPAAPDPPPEAAENRPPGRARLGLALRLGARDSYDHLGALLFQSAAWTLLAVAGAASGQALGLALLRKLPPSLAALGSLVGAGIGLLLLGAPATAGVFRYTRNAAARREPEWLDLAWGFRQGLGKALGLATLQALIALLLAGNCYFYVLQRLPVLVVLGAVFGYLFLFWLLASLYQWPLLAEQELRPVAAIKKSALLVLDNFPYTVGLGVVLALLTLACWATMLGGVILWAGAAAMVLTQGTRELLRKYGVLGPDPTLDPIADEIEP